MSKSKSWLNLLLWPGALLVWPTTPQWIVNCFSHADYQINLVLLLILILIAGVKASKLKYHGLQPLPWQAVALICCALGLLIVNRYTAHLNIISGSTFLIAIYAMTGMFLTVQQWQQLRSAAFLLIILLPFNAHLETYLGFPLRTFTAQVVAAGFSPLQPTLTSGVVLQWENTVAAVDIPCSGIRSIWTGAVFYCLLTMILGKGIDWRWTVIGGCFGLAIICGNTIRVFILTSLYFLKVPGAIIDALHSPIGLIPFLIVCAAAGKCVAMLPAPKVQSHSRNSHTLVSPLALLGLLIIAAVTLPTPKNTSPAQRSTSWLPPANLNATKLEMSSGESRLFQQTGSDFFAKYRFTLGSSSGSFLMVRSKNWQSHHNPTQCLTTISDYSAPWHSRPTIIGPGIAVRLLEQQGTRGLFWFIQGDYTTGDYTERVYKGMLSKKQPWVMVTILFDQSIDDQHVTEIVEILNQAAKQLSRTNEE